MAINPSHTSEIKIISGVNSSISVVFFIMQFKVPALGTKEQDKSNHKKSYNSSMYSELPIMYTFGFIFKVPKPNKKLKGVDFKIVFTPFLYSNYLLDNAYL